MRCRSRYPWVTRCLAAAICLRLISGCGGAGHATSQTTGSASSTGSVPAQPAMVPDPCRDLRGFVRAVRKLERQPGVEVSANARRALRLLSRNGASNCRSSGAYLDQIQTITKK
jgi:hypothetical protein